MGHFRIGYNIYLYPQSQPAVQPYQLIMVKDVEKNSIN